MIFIIVNPGDPFFALRAFLAELKAFDLAVNQKCNLMNGQCSIGDAPIADEMPDLKINSMPIRSLDQIKDKSYHEMKPAEKGFVDRLRKFLFDFDAMVVAVEEGFECREENLQREEGRRQCPIVGIHDGIVLPLDLINGESVSLTADNQVRCRPPRHLSPSHSCSLNAHTFTPADP